jgi:hypothetical protein
MAVRRSKKKTKSKAAEAYEQTILAEGAPAALDLLGIGSTISDIIHGKPRKAAKKRRAKKKARAKVKMSRTKRTKKAKKKSARRTSRRRK